MFTKVALNPQLSRKTIGRIHRYIFDFGAGAHRVFWDGDRAYIETDDPADAALLKETFPTMVGNEVEATQSASSR
ncbi:hypothetical protein DZD18_05365 [Rhodobacteraceae bacterium W635]|uniref:hypothetical protein n=1 Tax=Nioella halotolerans TaxID=2303578 RepID=UPI000E3DA5B0|nr:hypothetical protein DZD18_05365 [Rhodobacteraceae bacterium W635]